MELVSSEAYYSETYLKLLTPLFLYDHSTPPRLPVVFVCEKLTPISSLEPRFSSYRLIATFLYLRILPKLKK